MLTRLSVDNYALIDHLEVEFDSRLNIITGQTGAGKSILLGALSLLLGEEMRAQLSKTTLATASLRPSLILTSYN